MTSTVAASRSWPGIYDGPLTTHVSLSEPFDPVLRADAVDTGLRMGLRVHDAGTVVVIDGPRFATAAESAYYTREGFDIINMTAYPEAGLARELEVGYVSVAHVTDYDSGLSTSGSVPPVSAERVARSFAEQLPKVRTLLAELACRAPESPSVHVSGSLARARLR